MLPPIQPRDMPPFSQIPPKPEDWEDPPFNDEDDWPEDWRPIPEPEQKPSYIGDC